MQVEKARDVMNRFPSTPVILAAASKFIDPLDFAKHMMISLHRAVHLNPIRSQLDV